MGGRVAVVGGGVAGLLTAARIRWGDVDVFEVRPSVGSREHCSGVVSTVTAEEVLARGFTQWSYRYLLIRAGPAEVVMYSSTPFACRIDRLRHESFLAEVLEGLGHRVLLKRRVLSVEEVEGGVLVKYAEGSLVRSAVYDYAVITEGYPPRLAREAGFRPVTEALVGAQYWVVSSRAFSELLSEALVVNYGADGEGGFTWFAPVGRREGLVGAATKAYRGAELIELLNALVKASERALRTGLRKVKLFGGYVLRGHPKQLIKGRVASLGDANTTVKSVSGGGLYPINLASRYVAKALPKEGLKREETEIITQLKKQYLITKAVNTVTRHARKTRILTTTIKITPNLYDKHEKLLEEVLRRREVGVGLT